MPWTWTALNTYSTESVQWPRATELLQFVSLTTTVAQEVGSSHAFCLVWVTLWWAEFWIQHLYVLAMWWWWGHRDRVSLDPSPFTGLPGLQV